MWRSGEDDAANNVGRCGRLYVRFGTGPMRALLFALAMLLGVAGGARAEQAGQPASAALSSLGFTAMQWPITINAAGIGYNAGDTVTLSCPGTWTANPAVGISQVNGSNQVTQLGVTVPGSAVSAPASATCRQASTSGSGSGLQITLYFGPIVANVSFPTLTGGGAGNYFAGGETPSSSFAGTEDTFVGDRAGGNFTGYVHADTAVGHDACGIFGTSPTGNYDTCLGDDAGRNISGSASNNTLLGFGTGETMFGSENVIVGSASGEPGPFSGSGNTIVGKGSGTSSTGISGTGNTTLGQGDITSLTTGSGNLVLGPHGGTNLTTGGYNFIAGPSGCNIANGTYSNQVAFCGGGGNWLYIANVNTLSTAQATWATPISFSYNVTATSTLNLTGLTSDSGQSDATVCDVTGTGKIYYGSGTGGICLTTSSIRFKTDIRQAVHGAWSAALAMADFMRLDTVSWNYRPGHGFDPRKRYEGWTAEQMSGVYPELVGYDAAGRPNSVDMMGVLPRTVAAVQIEQYEIGAIAFLCVLLAAWCVLLTCQLAAVRRRMTALQAARMPATK